MRVFEVVVSMPLSNEGWRSFLFWGFFPKGDDKNSRFTKTLNSFALKKFEKKREKKTPKKKHEEEEEESFLERY